MYSEPDAKKEFLAIWERVKWENPAYFTLALIHEQDKKLHTYLRKEGSGLFSKWCKQHKIPHYQKDGGWTAEKATEAIAAVTKFYGYRPPSTAVKCIRGLNTLMDYLYKNGLSYGDIAPEPNKHGASHQENWVRAVIEKATDWEVEQNKYLCVGSHGDIKDEIFQVDLVIKGKKLIVEVMGKQHYKIRHNGDSAEDELAKTKKRDKMRRKAIKDLGWSLIEISYKQQAPDTIISLIEEYK